MSPPLLHLSSLPIQVPATTAGAFDLWPTWGSTFSLGPFFRRGPSVASENVVPEVKDDKDASPSKRVAFNEEVSLLLA